eukprot:scaffold198639_cov24-Attheya_sp.AAC.1
MTQARCKCHQCHIPRNDRSLPVEIEIVIVVIACGCGCGCGCNCRGWFVVVVGRWWRRAHPALVPRTFFGRRLAVGFSRHCHWVRSDTGDGGGGRGAFQELGPQ